MKSLLSYFLVTFLLLVTNLNAQDTYNIAGQQLTLKSEVEGTITLLWNTLDGEYRYFLKKGIEITELKNTRIDGKYQEEYKQVLRTQTEDLSVSVKKVKLTTASLKSFFIEYNKLKNPDFVFDEKSVKLKLRLGAFIGITNSIFSENPDNKFLPTLGFDFEIVDEILLKRHSIVFQFKQTFESSDYKYSASEFSMNYRFKFVKTQKLDVFLNTKFAGYSYITSLDYADGIPISNKLDSDSSFQGFINFGVGADYALGNGYLTFSYNDIVSLTNDTNGEFPLDFILGYKLNL